MRGPRVLIVDDHADTVSSLGMALEMHGYEAHLALTAREALRVAASIQPDVIFLDISVPDMSGIEICRQIRGEDWGRKALVVVITGWTTEEHRDAARHAGCDKYMVKPVPPHQLITMLEEKKVAMRVGVSANTAARGKGRTA